LSLLKGGTTASNLKDGLKEEHSEHSNQQSSAAQPSSYKALSEINATWKSFFEVEKPESGSLVTRFAKKELIPRAEAAHVFDLHIENGVEVKIFEEFRADALDFLRKWHGREDLQIETIIKEEDNTTRQPYTNSERFQAMLQQYPIVREMHERFGLDPDF
jgi:hypothetical protein